MLRVASLFRRGQSPTSGVETARVGARHRFAIGDDLATWQALTSGTATTSRVSRVEASRVPAVKRARDLIAGTIAALPLHAVNASGVEVTHALLDQPERLSGLVRSVTIARTVEDLLYESAALWLVVQRTTTGYPAVIQRIESPQWHQDIDTGVIRIKPPEVNALGREVPAEDVIVFTSPSDPLLVAGAPAIRALLRLEATASLYLDEPQASTYFAAADGVDPADPDEVESFLTGWKEARRTRATAYVPAGVELRSIDRLSAEELQLIQAREFSIVEVARLTGIDPSWLGVNVTTRTYSNIVDERRSFIDFVLSPYMRAIEERLSLGDCTPRGQRVRFNLDGFLRAATTERYNAHKTALDAGFLTLNEVRALENRPPLEATGGQ